MTGGDNNKSKSIPIVCLLVSWLLFNHAIKLLMKKAHQVKESAVYVDCRVFFQNPFFPHSCEDSRFKGTMTRDLLLQVLLWKSFTGPQLYHWGFFLEKSRRYSPLKVVHRCQRHRRKLLKSTNNTGKYCWKVPMTRIAKNLSPVLLKLTLTVVINSQLRISPRIFRKNSKWPQFDD